MKITSIMRKTHEVAPFEEQDKLKEKLLKTKEGDYFEISTVSIWVKGERGLTRELTTFHQNELEKGLIRILDGSYCSIDSIKKIEEDGCFVATTVYGDINAPQVTTLRKFRDEILKQSMVGRTLIDMYYSGLGRKVADFLRKQPLATNLVRNGLDFVVRRYSPDS